MRRVIVSLVVVVGVLAGCGLSPTSFRSVGAAAGRQDASASRDSTEPAAAAVTTTTTAPVVSTTTTAPVVTTTTTSTPPAATTGDARLDQLLPTLPSVLFEAGAHVHFGYNPVDCCHAGGYNPEPNDVWVSERALASNDRLTYVTVHELAHSVHLRTSRAAALTAAVAGAPVVRAGTWDDSEKVADCVAWVLYPRETAASGLTYWSCPEPWRGQTRAALA